MNTIHTLPDEVVAQIAAGEVIERPAYVIKELLDNAIDAKATKIQVDLSGVGSEKMSIVDDGVGMSHEDIALATKLHATSKMKTIEDFQSIHTLGFRGEALSSIAAVSELTMYSRAAPDPTGYKFQSHAGTIESAGMPVGTRVVVEKLFSKVPVRKMFLKSPQTERRIILDIITAYSLAYPEIHFISKVNKKIVFERTGESLLERYLSLYNDLAESDLIPVCFEDSYLSVSGFIGKPNRSFTSTHEQYFTVNHRPISDRLLSNAIKEAFGTLLPRDQYPSAVLHIDIPVQLLDVNVHPRKEQISFSNPDHIFITLKSAIQEVLSEHNLTFQTAGWGIFSQRKGKKYRSITDSIAGSMLKNVVRESAPSIPKFDWKKISQWHKTYITVQTASGLTIIDQHAAHERILYEKLVASSTFQKKTKSTTILSIPQELSLTKNQERIVEEYKTHFEEAGFVLGKNESNRYVVLSVPTFFSDRDVRKIFEEYISDIQSDTPVRSVDSITQKLMLFVACRSAIKAGDVLTSTQMQSLIEELLVTKNKYTCPHGRPTMIEVRKKDLDILFKRE